MAKKEHLKILTQGVEEWNKWREKNPRIFPNLRNANLSGMNLLKADLSGANLVNANLSDAKLSEAILNWADLTSAHLNRALINLAQLFQATLNNADLSGAQLILTNLSSAILTNAKLIEADLSMADLASAKFSGVSFHNANLYGARFLDADLTEADLSGANLRHAQLINTNLSKANISDCLIFGISAWKLNLQDTIQTNLNISDKDEPNITVDNLEVAQFIYLLLHNEKIREVIDTIGKKAVLILGRFTPERINILDLIREELRKHDYLPILFDFEKPNSKDLTETVSTLAHMSRFIIADLTDAKAIPQELQAIVPNLPSVAVQPIIHIADQEYGMFEHFKKYPWVLPIYKYRSIDNLIAMLDKKVIKPVEAKVKELRKL